MNSLSIYREKNKLSFVKTEPKLQIILKKIKWKYTLDFICIRVFF